MNIKDFYDNPDAPPSDSFMHYQGIGYRPPRCTSCKKNIWEGYIYRKEKRMYCSKCARIVQSKYHETRRN